MAFPAPFPRQAKCACICPQRRAKPCCLPPAKRPSSHCSLACSRMAAARNILAIAYCLKFISTEKHLETSSVYPSLAFSLPERGVPPHAARGGRPGQAAPPALPQGPCPQTPSSQRKSPPFLNPLPCTRHCHAAGGPGSHPRRGACTPAPVRPCQARPGIPKASGPLGWAEMEPWAGQGRPQVGLARPGQAVKHCSPALVIQRVQVHETALHRPTGSYLPWLPPFFKKNMLPDLPSHASW